MGPGPLKKYTYMYPGLRQQSALALGAIYNVSFAVAVVVARVDGVVDVVCVVLIRVVFTIVAVLIVVVIFVAFVAVNIKN